MAKSFNINYKRFNVGLGTKSWSVSNTYWEYNNKSIKQIVKMCVYNGRRNEFVCELLFKPNVYLIRGKLIDVKRLTQTITIKFKIIQLSSVYSWNTYYYLLLFKTFQ